MPCEGPSSLKQQRGGGHLIMTITLLFNLFFVLDLFSNETKHNETAFSLNFCFDSVVHHGVNSTRGELQGATVSSCSLMISLSSSSRRYPFEVKLGVDAAPAMSVQKVSSPR